MSIYVDEAKIVQDGSFLEILFKGLNGDDKGRVPLKVLRALDSKNSCEEGVSGVLLKSLEIKRGGSDLILCFHDGAEDDFTATRLADLAGLVPVDAEGLDVDLIVSGADWLMTCAPESLSQVALSSGDASIQPGPAEESLGLIANGAVAVRAGRVTAVGTKEEVYKNVKIGAGTKEIHAKGLGVAPGLVDPHTHPVFGGERSKEFALRAAGASYAEIAEAGGGIRSTMRATREASFQELKASALGRLSNLLNWGVTTIEAKSGYSLNLEGELRMLKVLKQIAPVQPVDISPTLLAAHVVPPEYIEDREAYVKLIIEEIIPRAVSEGLAESCDAFCEKGAFTTRETRLIMEAAKAQGLGVRVHAEQFTDTGGAALAAELGALSADHLEAVSKDAIDAMAQSGTVAVLLPGAAMTVGDVFPDARQFIDSGVQVALGTDLNPGTSMTESLSLMMSIACTQCGMTPAEAWLGVTVNSAKALNRPTLGRLKPGSPADMVLLRAPNYSSIPYHLAHNYVEFVFKNGVLVRGSL